MSFDPKAFGEGAAKVLKAHVAQLLAPLNAKLAKVESDVEGLIALKDEPAQRGEPGRAGDKGEPGRSGADGVGVRAALVDAEGQLVITLTNGDVQRCGVVVGRNGDAGAPGAPGAPAEPLDMDALRRVAAEAAREAAEDVARAAREADEERIAKRVTEALRADLLVPSTQHGTGAKASGPALDMRAVRDRIKLEVREAIDQLPAPERGAPGADADMDALRALAEKTARDVAEKAAADLPTPERGEPGAPGADADMDALTKAAEAKAAEIARAAAREAVADLPKPKDGADADMDALSALAERTARAVAEEATADLPAPEPGKPGRDGIGVKSALIGDDGQLVLTTTDGTVHKAGRVVGRDGGPGADGLGFDDLRVEPDGERGFALVWSRGDRIERSTVSLPVMIDRGVWAEGRTYEAGDAVTWGGSVHVAQARTEAKPETSDDWRLAVKRGRDGRAGLGIKDAVVDDQGDLQLTTTDGKTRRAGHVRGRPGRDLTRRLPDGTTY